MIRRKWLYPVWTAIVVLLACAFVLYQRNREVTIETVIVNDVPTPPGNVKANPSGARFNNEVEAVPTEQDNSGASTSGSDLSGDLTPDSHEAFSSDLERHLELKENVSKAQRGMAEMRESPEVDASKPQSPQTLRDLWRETGLSDEELEQAMALLPIDPTISLDQSDELMANLQAVQSVIDSWMKEATATLTLDEARIMIDILKDDPTTTEDEYRYITRELFPPDIQQALIQEGKL